MSKRRNQRDVYVAVDIEADGPLPGVNSMLQLGAAAFVVPEGRFDPAAHREPIWTYEGNLATIEGGVQDPETMQWWGRQDPAVWEAVTKDPRDPAEVMTEFDRQVRELPGRAVMVTYPSWDFMWVHWYLVRFTGRKSPFGIGCLDMKSYAFATFNTLPGFKNASKRNFPKWMSRGCPRHNHTARQDAIGQGIMFVNLMAHVRDDRS